MANLNPDLRDQRAEFMLMEDSLNTPFNIKSIDIGYYEGGRFY